MNLAAPVVFVVDDDASVRRSLGRLLRSAGLAVEILTSAEEFLHACIPEGPACLVLDMHLPGLDGLTLQEHVASMEHSLPIIFITGHGTVHSSVRAMKAGALDFLEKPFSDEDLLRTVRSAIEKDSRTLEERAERLEIQRRIESLTARERQVLALVVTGALNKQIANHLGTSEKTVKVHRARVMQKMQARSVADLVRMAGKVQLRQPDLTSTPAPT
jgi:RNA polymerase sigma factor (sigma-70 family)